MILTHFSGEIFNYSSHLVLNFQTISKKKKKITHQIYWAALFLLLAEGENFVLHAHYCTHI